MESNKVCIIGNVFGGSGYDIHTRFLAESLYDLGYEVSIDCPKPTGWELGCPDKLFKILRNPISNDTVIVVGLPPFWSLKIMDKPKHFIGFCIWEGTSIPEHYLEHINKEGIDEVWVASESTKKALLNTGKIKPPIYTVSEGVDTDLFKPTTQIQERPFTFLYVKGWTEGINDRSGVQYLLKAYIEEFKKEENVNLLIKINMAYANPNWNLGNELLKLGIDLQTAPKIAFSTQDIGYSDLPSKVYSRGDCFVAPTRGEAFGLTMAEAMSCELPIIATNFGGQTDFIIDKEYGFLIDYKLEEVKHSIMFEEIKWATPDLEDLKKKMRWMFEHRNEAKEMGKKAREHIVNNFQWKHCALKAKEALDKL